jgi:hypothetical protein
MLRCQSTAVQPATEALHALRLFHRAACRALRSFVHPQGVGKIIDGMPKHQYSRERCERYRMLCKTGQAMVKHHAAFHRDEFGWKTVAANQAGEIRYYTSSPNGAALLYLDLDPPGHEEHRKHGTPYTPEALADRDAAREWLLEQASQYLFVSADERLYLKLTGPVDRELLRELGRALNAASPYKTDIEIKGTYRTPGHAGCLARLPFFRQLDHGHIEQFIQTPATDHDLVRGWIQQLRQMAGQPEQKSIVRTKKRQAGSTSFAIDLGDTAAAADRYWPDCPRKAGQLRVTLEDHRTLFAILRWCPPNPDGTNPYKRHQALWSAMYAEGRTSRPFNFARYKVLRDYYSSVELIDWDDVRHYVRPGRKGKAAQWRFQKKTETEQILVKGRFLKPRLVAPPAAQHEKGEHDAATQAGNHSDDAANWRNTTVQAELEAATMPA